MSIEQAQLNLLWARVIIEELRRLGVNHFVLSPGSRSTPLVVAIAESEDKLKCSVHYDERGAAYFALGLSSAAGQPTALVCTSGTATANYLPAIIEASQDGLPLIVITADRPPELHNVGANQTINQTDIYGSFVRDSAQISCPDVDTQISELLETVDRIVFTALSDNPGPVHLNCMFRKPLVPPAEEENISIEHSVIPEKWKNSSFPFLDSPTTISKINPDDIAELGKAIASAETGLIVAGRLTNLSDREAILKLADTLDWLILADIQSGLRLGNNKQVIAHHSLWFAQESQLDNVAVLHFGGRTVATAWQDSLTEHKPGLHAHIDVLPTVIDPGHTVTHRIVCSPTEFVAALDSSIISLENTRLRHNIGISVRDREVGVLIDQIIKQFDHTSEIACARLISSMIPSSHCMFVANSMAVRDMDSFAVTGGNKIPVAANRGASGIDGNIASAAGFGLGHNRPVMALVGDLALLHDINSLSLLHELPQPSIVVVVNNHGGGIFDLLPVADRTDILDKYFIVQHEMNFQHTAMQFGLQYQLVSSNSALSEAITSALKAPQTSLIEVQVERSQSLKLRQKIQREIAKQKTGRLA